MTSEPKYEVLFLDGEQKYGPFDTWDEAAKKVEELGWGRWENSHVFIITAPGVEIKAKR